MLMDKDDQAFDIDPANTARSAATKVLPVQMLDAAGAVVSTASPSVANSAKLSPVGGSKTVTTSGTGVALATTTKVKYLYVRAKSTNGGTIYFGDSAVDATTSKQITLTANQFVTLTAEPGFYLDLAEFFIDASVNGEGVDFLYIG